MKKINITLILTLSLSLSTQTMALPVDQITDYDNRYQLTTPEQKLINNKGDGYENLYGTRNFRVVLKGLLYRGGANNVNNKYGKKSNQNPLPQVALKNLCEESFKSAIYLYETNFKLSEKTTHCVDIKNNQNTLNYQQITAFDEKNTNQFLEIIYDTIKEKIKSPIYIHCWNGWHASGLISTLALRQFCDYTADDALEYWIKNTDGNSDGFNSIKRKIQNFKPIEKFKITRSEKEKICL